MRILSKYTISIAFILSLVIGGCHREPIREYHTPQHINDGIEVGSLEEVDMDSNLLKKALRRISRGKYGEVHSMLIFKDNKLVFDILEKYILPAIN